MASQSVSRVVGYSVQVVHNTLCRETQHSVSHSSNPGDLGKCTKCPLVTVTFGKYLPLPSEANSRRSSSLRGKLTYVESLLVRMFESEKRFRSERSTGSRSRHSQFKITLLCFKCHFEYFNSTPLLFIINYLVIFIPQHLFDRFTGKLLHRKRFFAHEI